MRKMETFIDEREVRDRVDQLKAQGVSESSITIVANRDLDMGGAFGDYSDVNIKSSEGSPWDKVVSFFTGEDTRNQPVNDSNMTPGEEEEFRQALNENKIVLYVNGEVTDAPEGTRARTTDDLAATNRDRDVVDNSFGDATGVSEGAAAGTTGAYAATDRNRNTTTDDETLELREERLNVDKENVKTGEVNIDKHVETDHQEFDVPVERDEVTVERRPVDDKRPTDDSAFIEGDESIRVPVHEEKVNVDKESVVSEEVVVNKERVQDKEHVSEDVRREDVDIDETTGNNRRDDRI
ncbi:YsnF/AvaK domain-containing protein [Salinicoccus sesuvii]|uniref:YsnF/AvaK domain-containing protein n=1 Tax=Salinicoccus sesuvii TaxID=868281 RepID=A0ABV7N461_9STAP